MPALCKLEKVNLARYPSGKGALCKRAIRGFDSRPRLMELKLFIASKAFIIRNGKVLIVRESTKYSEGTQAAHYDVVGGRLKPGEKFDESLKREVKEESGLDVVIGSPFFVNESWPVVKGEQWQIVRVFFKCESADGDVSLSNDHDMFEWIDPKEHMKHPIIDNLKPVFEQFLKL